MTFEQWTRQRKGLEARDSYDRVEPEFDDLQRSLTTILPRYQQQENDLKKMEQEFIRLSKLQAQSSGADADRLNTQLQQIQKAYDRTYQEYAYNINSYNKAATQASGLLEKYSQYRSTEVSGKAKKDTEYGLGYQDLNYEYINGGSNGVRERIIKQLATGAYSDREEQGVLHRLSPYQYMTEAEILNYNYIYGRKGKSEANRYLRDLQETLNYRWANNMFEKVEGKPVLELLLGIPAGLEQFGSGMESAMNLLKGDGGKRPASATQMLSTMIDKDMEDVDLKWFNLAEGKWKDANIFGKSLGQVLHDATTTTSNMVPSILASAATNVIAPGVGSYVGLAALGSSAAGNAYQEKMNLGYSQSEATNYAVLVGALEALLQSALGGIGKLGQKTLSKTALNNLSKIDNVLGRVAKKAGSTVGGKLLTSSMSEGFEEGLQAILEPVIWSAVSDEKLDVNAEEVLYSSLLGFMTGGMFEGVELSSDASHVNSQYKQLGEQIIAGKGLESLRALAGELAGVTEGGLRKQLQNQVKKVSGEKVKAADVGRLYEMVQSAVTPETMARLEATRKQQTATQPEDAAQGNTVEPQKNAAPEGGYEVGSGTSTPGRTTTGTQQGRPLTFQEEVQRQFEEANRPPEKVQKQYDIDEVFSAVQAARNNGSISEERYNDIVETLSYAQSDFAEGSISETEFQGALGTVMRQMGQGYNVSQGTVAATVSATDPLVDVNRDTWQQAQRLAQALGRDIVFYNGAQGENGYYKDGTIYVNIMAQDPFAQVVSHELTHSLEGTKHYDKLKRFVFAQLSKSGVDIAQTRDAKYQQYKRHGKTLENDGAIDAEIVAEYVQTHLLTDEAAITSLVQTEPNVAKRILNWVKNLAARTVGPKAARERAKLDQISRIYAKALQESQGENAQPGAVSVNSQFGGETKVDAIQQSRDQTEADFREGRIDEDEYDAVMDEFDRAENERLGRSLEKYSFAGEHAKNADLEALEKAKQMRQSGVADETIRQQTGWFMGRDGKWRWEIDDSGMEYSGRGDMNFRQRNKNYDRYRQLTEKQERHMLELSDEQLTGAETKELQQLREIYASTFRRPGRISEDALPMEQLSDYIKHDALFEAYPQLRKTRLRFADLPEGTRGQYDPEQDIIILSKKLRGKPQDTLIHEIQHVIQKAEGFAQGSSPEFWDNREVIKPEYASAVQKARNRVERAEHAFRREWTDDTNLNLAKQYIELDDRFWSDEMDPGKWQEIEKQKEQIEQIAVEDGWEDLFNDYYYAVGELQMAIERAKWHLRTPIDLYSNTAGEIEARDSTARRMMTQEQRKNTPPDLGDENTVFAEGDAVAKDFVGWNADGNEVYTTSQDTLKLSISDRIAKFKDDFLNNFRGRTAKFSRNGHTHYARFVETTKGLGKFTYEGDSRSSPNGYKAKIRMLADGNIFELVEDADYKNTGTETGKTTKSHKKAKHWDYYVKTIVVDGKGFDVIVNVRVDVPGGSYSSKEEFVYSILFKDNKTVATSVVSPASSKVLRQNDVATKNIIDQDIENVNNAMRIGADGTSGEQYSFSDVQTDEQSRRPAEGDYATDEVEMQARKKGYPVLHGEQVVPFRTWVQTKDRGNYGLVTGLAAENKLLISFHNKHDGGTADNVAIPYGEVVPVPGAYQMTKEEFASLMASEPLNPGSENLSEEDMRAIEELYHQAKGNEEKAVAPIELEKLPRKAQNYLKRAQRNLLNKLCSGLGVPRAAMQEHLQGVVEDITSEYLNSGTISDEKLGELFDKAYSQGIVTDREFYDQYKHIKDYLRTTAITISEQNRSNIADFQDFRNRQFGRLRIVNKGGLPIDSAYEELRNMAPELFPESITHPADQLVQMAEVARSIAISKKTLDEFYGPEKEIYRSWAKNDFDAAVGDIVGDLHALRRFADERAAAGARDSAPTTAEEAEEVYKNLKKARRTYERVAAKNLLTQHDEVLVGRLLRHEMELEHLNPETDNVKGITAVYEAKAEYERLSSLIAKYKRHLHSELRTEADKYLQTADKWKDKKTGIAYSRETMRRNIYDIIPDRNLARDINEAYFEPVHDAEARAVRMKDDYRNKVRSMNLSRKVDKGNLVSEAHAVQLLGEAEDNIRILENTRGRMQHRDGKTLAEWRAVVMNLWAENPQLDQSKIRGAVQQFREIYDDLFKQMNRVRVENGYEPINYRSGYFPHFQPGAADGILAQFGRALGIDTQVVALPTTITGLTHTFKPGIQWFGNAQERLGFNTAYDAVEGFDKYIEGASSVIFQTRNIQRLRAFATQVRYRTSDEGIKERVDAVYEDNRLTDEEKQIEIADIYEHGEYELANFVAELDEYTNLLANKKSKYDRTIEALMGRRIYAFLKWWESRVGANMIAGNISSALTNFIPLTQTGAQLDKGALLKGMWQTLASYKTDDGLVEVSTFLTNRRGSDPLVQNWQQKTSAKLGRPMECIDQFVSGSIVRAAYQQNLKRGMSEAEAMHQADIFASGVMADRSKGSMPTLMQASNPLFKMFTQFQLEVNNQFSEVFKDLPRNHMEKGKLHVALVLFRYFLGAWLFNELYERLVGRRAALDPFGILVDAGKDFADPDVGFGEGVQKLTSNILGELPYSSGLTLFGFDTDGGRIPASSAVPDLSAILDAATEKGWSGEKRWKELQDELNKLAYIVPPFGGNQVSKIWKGTKAFIEGGSYSVDAKGNDILQYPVYKDDPWSALGALFRATVLGKSSLPEAQEWVNSGFDGLNAKETAVYQDMLDAGVSQKDAFALLQEIGAAKKTDDLSREEVQRNILRNSDASNEAKAIAYYGILASTERDTMDQLAEMGADSWEVTKALMAMKDAGSLEGAAETKAKYDAIIQASLTDEEKAVLVGTITGTNMLTEKGNPTQYAKFKIAIEGGMTVDEYLEFRKAGGSIDEYLDFAEAGLEPDDAADVVLALDDLNPLDGKKHVSDLQKWRTCVDMFSSEVTQLAALAGVMTEKQYQKVEIACDYSIGPVMYVALRETLLKHDVDANGSMNSKEVTAAIDSMRGLTQKQKAVLWQLSVSSKSAKNNPYSSDVGQRVLDALINE